MAEEGIEFVVSTEIGKDLSSKKLVEDFDSVVLCCGATKPRDLPIEGRELKGVHFAMEFLTKNTQGLLELKDITAFETAAKGKDAVVIGGGDTEQIVLEHLFDMDVKVSPNLKSCLDLQRNVPRIILGQSGPKFTRWIMGRKKLRKSSVLTPANILLQLRNLLATRKVI